MELGVSAKTLALLIIGVLLVHPAKLASAAESTAHPSADALPTGGSHAAEPAAHGAHEEPTVF